MFGVSPLRLSISIAGKRNFGGMNMKHDREGEGWILGSCRKQAQTSRAEEMKSRAWAHRYTNHFALQLYTTGLKLRNSGTTEFGSRIPYWK